MNRAHTVLDGHQQPLVIVHDFNVFWAFARPAKADSELAIDPNAVLTCAIAPECFKAIARRRSQEVERLGGM